MRVRAWKLCLALLLAPPAGAAPPAVYHSPNDDGISGGMPAVVAPGTGVSLHLYLGVGSTPSTADPCRQGDGDELCGHRVQLTGSDVAFQSFTPADPDLVFNLGSGALWVTGGAFQTGELGPTKLGDLVVDALAGDGSVDLALGEFVNTQLVKETATTPVTIVQLPEPGTVAGLAACATLLLLLNRHRSRFEGVSR